MGSTPSDQCSSLTRLVIMSNNLTGAYLDPRGLVRPQESATEETSVVVITNQ